MTNLKTFSQTCHQPYDRHDYKVVYSNGKVKVLDDYMDVYEIWLTTESSWLSHVEVIDKKTKKSHSKGFS